MNSSELDALTRTAAQRRSLLALAGAGLAALGGTFGAAAKPKPGKIAKKKARAKCKAQVSQCTLVASLTCNQGNDPEACKETFLPCCDFLATCNAGAMLQCILT